MQAHSDQKHSGGNADDDRQEPAHCIPPRVHSLRAETTITDKPYLVSETVVSTGDAGTKGFRRLFNYISGSNTSQAKIAMTAPVERVPTSEKIDMTAPVERVVTAGGWRVTFMLPSEYTLENAPVPTDERVQIREVPGRVMAVLKYSGRWTDTNLEKRSAQLLDAVSEQAVRTVGDVISAAYDPPFMPPFFRRNEVMVQVQTAPAPHVPKPVATAFGF